MPQLLYWRILQVKSFTLCGYFMICIYYIHCSCNRYDAQLKATQTLHQRRQTVLKDCKDWEEMSKFLHYYERYKEHIKSYQVILTKCGHTGVVQKSHCSCNIVIA